MSGSTLPTHFDAAPIEARWQALWAEKRYFLAPAEPTGRPFTLIHPPPNVTGVLTLGHMLGDTVRDVLTRWHRMRGDPTLWLPGLDHAGLATQVEVRRRLARQGVELEKLPREEILRHLEAWKAEHEARILAQEKAGGFSIDWSRYRYTMDPGATRATREVFVRLFDAGLIYRGERIVNWDPKLRTAVSDLEVQHEEEEADLLYLRYAWSDGSPGGLTVATVRPETIFGDVAVAVHPDDERHRSAVGRRVRVPLTDRDVPVVTDAAIDPAFGNGALKVTPRHDLVDYEVFRRHPELEMPPDTLDDAGVLTGDRVPERFRGLDRDEARGRVAEALRDAGLLERTERYRHSVGRSERSKAVIEPKLSTQWFVRLSALAPPVVEAVRRGEIRIHPERWGLTFFRWMESLQDWCISRQIVWGHPVPVYYCDACGKASAAVEPPVRCRGCGASSLRSDPDVLDTWFTSWLWPFVTLGWPERTTDLARYYPTSVLVTGRDIMFFWVARMMMAGYYVLQKPPFTDVYFTGMLRDAEGRRMSKHLGNSPDPLEVIRERGADTLRFALLFPNPVDQDGPFGAGTLDGARNFLTKLWNLVRFAAGNLPPGTEPPRGPPALGPSSALENRWIVSRLRATEADVGRALDEFEFTKAAATLYGFVWHDLADRYVELSKEALHGHRGDAAAREARATLLYVLERTLRELHPMVPHVTEELWHALPHDGEALAVAPWPDAAEPPADPEAEVAMEVVLDAIRTLRNLRAENRLAANAKPAASVRPAGAEAARLLEAERGTILRLARVTALAVLDPGSLGPSSSASAVTPHGEFFLELPPEQARAETDQLERERDRLHTLLEKTRARLRDPGFTQRAPPEVVREAEAKARDLEERLQKIGEHLVRIAPQESSP